MVDGRGYGLAGSRSGVLRSLLRRVRAGGGLVTKPCSTLATPWTVCSPPGSSVHGILQARILEWVAISFSRGSSWPRDWTQVSCTAGSFFTDWATKEAPRWWTGPAEHKPHPPGLCCSSRLWHQEAILAFSVAFPDPPSAIQPQPLKRSPAFFTPRLPSGRRPLNLSGRLPLAHLKIVRCPRSPVKEKTTHSSTLAWRIPWTEEPGGLWSKRSQRVGHD